MNISARGDRPAIDFRHWERFTRMRIDPALVQHRGLLCLPRMRDRPTLGLVPKPVYPACDDP